MKYMITIHYCNIFIWTVTVTCPNASFASSFLHVTYEDLAQETSDLQQHYEWTASSVNRPKSTESTSSKLPITNASQVSNITKRSGQWYFTVTVTILVWRLNASLQNNELPQAGKSYPCQLSPSLGLGWLIKLLGLIGTAFGCLYLVQRALGVPISCYFVHGTGSTAARSPR
jgi:hypothetical protein